MYQLVLRKHRPHDAHCVYTDCADTCQEGNDLLLMRGEAVGVKFLRYCRIADLVLFPFVEHPFKRGAVAQLVRPSVGRDTSQDGDGVNLDGAGGSVSLESRFEGLLSDERRKRCVRPAEGRPMCGRILSSKGAKRTFISL